MEGMQVENRSNITVSAIVCICLSVDLHQGQSFPTVWPLRARHL